MIRKLFKIILGLTLSITILSLIFLTSVDWEPLEGKLYYKKTMERVGDLQFEESAGETWLAGWDVQNITPKEPTVLVGYKPRGNYEMVLDSSFVKTLVIGNGYQKIVFIGYPFMIIHPKLSKTIREKIHESEIPVDHIYFTASHTHSGYGGHMKGLVSDILYGGYDPEIVENIIKGTITSVRNSISTMDTVQLTYRKSNTVEKVRNRFVGTDPVDPFIRRLQIQKSNGHLAVLFTYSAHATTLSSSYMGLSGDYPHYLEKEFEKEFDWALYAAGAVGSHSPIITKKSIQTTKDYASSLYDEAKQNVIELADTTVFLKMASLSISMREPHFRVTDNYRLKPWVFNAVIGPSSPFFDVVRIGNLLFISSSGEVSGVFYEAWEQLANNHGMELMITTFNGEYIGYIPPDKYYDRHYRETRELNWYGPYNGQYFDELIKKLIVKAAE